jgi:hypothetical protein
VVVGQEVKRELPEQVARFVGVDRIVRETLTLVRLSLFISPPVSLYLSLSRKEHNN